jgi:pumilio RNA-binding family
VTDNQNIVCSNSFNGVSSNVNESAEIAAALSGMSLSSNGVMGEEKHVQYSCRRSLRKMAKTCYS